LKLIRNPEIANRLVENANSFCLKELTVDKMMDRTISIYQEVAIPSLNN